MDNPEDLIRTLEGRLLPKYCDPTHEDGVKLCDAGSIVLCSIYLVNACIDCPEK